MYIVQFCCSGATRDIKANFHATTTKLTSQKNTCNYAIGKYVQIMLRILTHQRSCQIDELHAKHNFPQPITLTHSLCHILKLSTYLKIFKQLNKSDSIILFLIYMRTGYSEFLPFFILHNNKISELKNSLRLIQ